ncbi:hypothetical protein vseg_019406 [Gypsophila vaccaria]
MRGVKSSIPHITTKHVTLIFLLTGTIFFIITSTFSSSSSSSSSSANVKLPKYPSNNCDKIPPTLSNALIHYATTNITPQQTPPEIALAARVLDRKSPCNFLVFGLGHDSLLWASLNHGGRTVFLEEDRNWIRQMRSQFPSLHSHHVAYPTRVRHAKAMLAAAKNNSSSEHCHSAVSPRETDCSTLAMANLPDLVYQVDWDVIMVDAPTGYHDDAPGRMQAIYMAGLLARWRRQDGDVDVFVHDVDRDVEDVFSKEFLCEGYIVEEEGKLRHFRIPSYKGSFGRRRPFCPTIVSNNSNSNSNSNSRGSD